MAVIKHIAIKNSSYTAAVEYLSYKHDEFTNKPILDENGRMILRDSYLIDGINSTPATYGIDCRRTNERFGKNQTKAEIKAHHYIISFDPRDRDENGLTPERAQELGLAFAKKYFPGHQVLVCTHPDGHNSAGNIHVHIVLNSVRAFDVERQDFMERPGDALAGHKHHVTKAFLEFLKTQTMEMCQQECLNQVDLLSPAKVRITDREYWAQRRGQYKLDAQLSAQGSDIESNRPKFETEKMILRRAIMTTAKDSHSFDEFQKKLFEGYGISVHESRGRISYILPDRTKPIRGRALGTDFKKASLTHYFIIQSRQREYSKKQSNFIQHPTPKGAKAQSPSSDFLHLITDIESCVKAQQSRAYAQKVKVSNLQQMSQTLIFLQEHGIDSLEELDRMLASTKTDFDEKRTALKSTESELRQVNQLIHATGQYLSVKSVHAEYLKARNKKKFREEHSSELSIYDTALKDLRAYYGDQKFMTIKQLKVKKAELTATKNAQYEDFCFARSKRKEIQTVSTNVQTILDQKREASRQVQTEQTQADQSLQEQK